MKKSEVKKDLTKKIALALGIGMFSIMPIVQALPTGGSSDTANISSNGTTMNISGVANNVINWQSFSIDKGETVSFDANNYLNLVHGPDISNIYGTLQGAGNIFLVNPNGIVFGSGAVINVGSLTASTAPINSVDTTAFLNRNTASITGSVTEGSDISMALVNVESANSLVLNAGEIVLQNTDMLDKVTEIKGAETVYLGTETGTYNLSAEQLEKLGEAQTNPAKLISNLAEIRDDLTGNYLLADDVDLSSTANFMPIGFTAAGEQGDTFEGYFNGMGHTISNMTMDTSALQGEGNGIYTGLFADVIGSVKNVTLKDATVTGGGVFGTGAVAGMLSNGIISNVAVIGNSSVSGAESYGGGIVGNGSGTITNVYNEASVSGGSDIGGIVGNYTGGKLYNAVNKGNVTASAGTAGGIVGQVILPAGETTIIDYVKNSGAVSSQGEYGMAGGIVGMLGAWGSESDTMTLNLTNAFNSGTVTGAMVKGAIVGGVDVFSATLSLAGSGDMYYTAGSGEATEYEGTTFGTVDATKFAEKSAGWGEFFSTTATTTDTSGDDNSSTETPVVNPVIPNNNTADNNNNNTADNNNNNQQPSISNMSEIFSLLDEMGVSTREGTAVLNDIGSVTKPETGERGNSSLAAMPMTEGTNGFGVGADTKLVENTDMAAPTGTPGAEPGTEPAAGDQGEASNDNSNNNDNDNGENDEENNENA